MKTTSDPDYINKEFQHFINTVYPGVTLPPPQLRDIKQAFIAGMLTTFVIRKQMMDATGVAFVDGHCDAIYKQVLSYGNELVARNASERN